jgi:hypothetical protein
VGIAAATFRMMFEGCGLVDLVDALQLEQWLPHFRTDLRATCLLKGNKFPRTPVNQIPWCSNPRKHTHQQRVCRFVVISVSIVWVCLDHIFS